MNKAVFLDRDGVLNAAIIAKGIPKPPMSIEEVIILDGVVDAIKMLKTLGFLTLVLTNQPDVARGIELTPI
jgi:D-glycero-D-manno-heptose 1,7-bisphosphate phosphatase